MPGLDQFSDEELERIARGQSAPQGPVPATPARPMTQRKNQLDIANTEGVIADRGRDNARADSANARADAAEARAARAEQTKQNTIEARGGVDTTESERKAGFLATRVAGGIKMLGRIGEDGAPSYWQKIAGDSELGNYVTEEDRQRVVAAQIDILDAALTLGTGAAYTREQIEGYRKSYFPQPGDRPGTIGDKKDRLKLLLEASRISAGGAAHFIDDAVNESAVFAPKKEEQRDTPPALGFAGAGDDRKSIPIPEQMQAEFQAGLRNVRTGDDFAALRDGLDRKYGFAPNTPEQMQANREYWGSRQGRGIPSIPPADAAMQVQDRLNNSLFNNRVGAAVMAAPIAAPFMDEAAGAVRSALNGTSYQVERDIANETKQNLQEQYPISSITGAFGGGLLGGGALAKAAPGLAQTLGGSFPRLMGTGAAFGGVSGAGEANNDRAAGALYGAGAGAAGAAAGRAIAPLLENITSSRPVQTVARLGNQAANMMRREPVPFQQAPRLSRTDNAVGAVPIDDIRQNVTDAQSLGLPYTLADATPQTRALAGSAARFSPNVRSLADDSLTSRQAERPERAMNAVRQYMAEPVDTAQRRQDLFKAGNIASSPLYEETFSRPAPIGDDISAILRTRTGKEALRRAYSIAENEGRDPTQLGFVLDEAGNVSFNDIVKKDQGRFERALMGDLTADLPRTTVRGHNGRDVTKVGPTDLVGFVRMRGGLQNQNNELGHMGLTNAGRKMDFAGPEQKFGPLVHADGMSYDEAAEAAWEAGYFPEFGNQRPSVNDFLDALRETHEGTRRRFRGEDMGLVDNYEKAAEQRMRMQETRAVTGRDTLYNDNSTSGAAAPFAPAEAYGKEVRSPTFETLDLVKRGIDSMVEGKRNPITGQLNLQGDPESQALDTLRKRLIGSLDRIEPKYAEARGEFAKYAKQADALDMGYNAPARNVLPRDMQRGLAGLGDDALAQYRTGYATRVSDDIAKTERGNPLESFYGSPGSTTSQRRAKVGALFPDAQGPLDRMGRLERDMTNTYQEVLGGSQTQPRRVADEQFATRGGDIATSAAIDMATGSPGVATGATALRGLLRNIADAKNLGGVGAQRKAEEIGPTLLGQDQASILRYLEELEARQRAVSLRQGQFNRTGGLFGSMVGSGVGGATAY